MKMFSPVGQASRLSPISWFPDSAQAGDFRNETGATPVLRRWSHSVLECGDWSPLFPLRRLVGEAAPRSTARRTADPAGFASSPSRTEFSRCLESDGDKSPAESGDKSPHSKVGAWLTTFCFFILHCAFCLRAVGQSYSIDWHTIDGGGGTSTGGVYSVSGTIGQPDAGRMSGGNFTIDGGFWGIISAVQTPGAPLLTIARTTTNTVAVSWPSPSTGFNLQVNTNGLGTVNWSNVVTLPSDDGAFRTVIVNPPTGNRFYRLSKP